MARKWIVIVAIAVTMIAGLAPWLRSQQLGVVAVEGGTLIDGTGAAPLRDSVIVIQNGKITAIGPRSRIQVPPGARMIDANGKYIIPGLIDGHVHYRSWMGELFLNNGITTIFDFGNNMDWILGVREAERSGKLQGTPRFWVVGAPINRPGGNDSASFNSAAGTPAVPMPAGTPNGAAWARQRAEELVARHVDAVKVTSDNLTDDEIKAITTVAHSANLKVIGHVDWVNRYVEDGFDGVVHMWGLSASLMTDANRKRWYNGAIMNPYAYMEPSKIEPMIRFLLAHHTGLQPMLMGEHGGMVAEARQYEAAVSALYSDPNLGYVPANAIITDPIIFRRDRSYSSTVGGFPYLEHLDAAHLAEARKGYQNALGFAVRYAKSGGLVWLGTDTPGAGTVPGMGLRQEIEQMVDGGLSPMKALQAATKNTADWFHIADSVGTLQAGRFGDMVLLDGNPLADIKNIDRIHAVIKGGQVLDGKYHRDYHPPIWTEEDDLYSGVQTNAAPALTSVTAQPGPGGSFIIVAKAHNIYEFSTLYLNDIPLRTRFVNIGELDASLPADQRPANGLYNITIRTQEPGGGQSAPLPVSLNNLLSQGN